MATELRTLDTESLQRPPALRSRDRIAIYSPSLPAAQWFPSRFSSSVKKISEALDVEVVLPKEEHWKGYTAGSPIERAAEFEALVLDKSVKAIFCSIGGFNSAEILPLLNAEVVRSNPKILVGYSDCTSLLVGLQAMGGWVTFHGPAVMTQFGEHPRPLPFTLEYAKKVMCGSGTGLAFEDPLGWTNERLEWSTGQWLERPRQLNSDGQRQILRAGTGRGHLFGGNIETLNFLVGTPYFAVPKKIVLFLEATEEEAFLPRVHRALTHLDQVGVLERTTALLFGRCPDCAMFHDVSLKQVLLSVTRRYSFPILTDLAFGHTDPMITLPLGVLAEVIASDRGSTIRLLETAVNG